MHAILNSKESKRVLLKWNKSQFEFWSNTPNVGTLICDIILPVKLPLSTAYEIHYQDKSTFTPSSLLEYTTSTKDCVVDIGLVLDVSGVDYYTHDSKEWEDWDVEYWSASEFDGYVPPEFMVEGFMKKMDEFRNGTESDRHIAVCAVQGYAMSGYFIVCYLIERMGKNVEEALLMYKNAIPPGVYCTQLVTRLYQKYYKLLPSSTTKLKVCKGPDWADPTMYVDSEGVDIGKECLAEMDSAVVVVPFERSIQDGEKNNSKKRKLPPPASYTYCSIPKKIQLTVDEQIEKFPYGTALDSNNANRICKALAKALHVDATFPGHQAIPLDEATIAAWKPDNYMISWRAEGLRSMLFVHQQQCYVIRPDLKVTQVPLKFFQKRTKGKPLDNTIIDGILVYDTVDGNKIPRFLAFDLLLLQGFPIWEKPFDRRLQYLQNEIFAPRKQMPMETFSKEPFKLRLKDHFPYSALQSISTKLIPKLCHPMKGYIFMPIAPAYPLKSQNIPIYQTSVDLALLLSK